MRCKSCAKKKELNPSWKKWKREKPACLDCGKQIAYDRVRCRSCSKKGHRNPQFGKLTSSSPKSRCTLIQRSEYKNWRDSVYRKDAFTCQICGSVGGKLNADHIKPWADFPELRYEISNGRMLCVECHLEVTKKYLKFNWKNQFMSARDVRETTFMQCENRPHEIA